MSLFGGSKKSSSGLGVAGAVKANTTTTNQGDDPVNSTSAPTAPGIDPNAEKERVDKALAEERKAARGGLASNVLFGLSNPFAGRTLDSEDRAYKRLLG